MNTYVAVSSRDLLDSTIFEHTVTGDSYEELLSTSFLPKVKAMGKLNSFWFMQDGARPHRTDAVFEILHQAFDSRIIVVGSSDWFAGAID